MKYYNLVTKKEQQGLKPLGAEWVEVENIINRPTEYPSSFYTTTTNKFVVVRDAVNKVFTDTLTFQLSPLESIQKTMLSELKVKRDVMLFGELTVGEETISILDERDIQVVTNLGDIPVKFKRGTADRIIISEANGLLFKKAYKEKVQAAFDWEEAEEGKILAFTTHDELKTYSEGV